LKGEALEKEPLVWGALWVLLGTVTAFLPIRLQRWPGIPLILSFPFLMVWIGQVHGWVWVVLGLLAFGSMMRNPLKYFWAKARGREPNLPAHVLREINRK
jgi:hypothetical protein